MQTQKKHRIKNATFLFWPLGGHAGQGRERRLLADHQLLVLLRDVALDLALVDEVGLEGEGTFFQALSTVVSLLFFTTPFSLGGHLLN